MPLVEGDKGMAFVLPGVIVLTYELSSTIPRRQQENSGQAMVFLLVPLLGYHSSAILLPDGD
jgi:hypothetical protein